MIAKPALIGEESYTLWDDETHASHQNQFRSVFLFCCVNQHLYETKDRAWVWVVSHNYLCSWVTGMPPAWFWPMLPELQPRTWIRQDKGLCTQAIQIRLPGLSGKVYLGGHKCPTLLLACFIYVCTHSCTVHSTASKMNEEDFTEEEIIWVETLIFTYYLLPVTLVPWEAFLTTAELFKTGNLHVFH